MKVHIIAAELDFAVHVARLETSEYYRRELTGEAAAALARAGRMKDALLALDEQTLEGFVEPIAMAHAAGHPCGPMRWRLPSAR